MRAASLSRASSTSPHMNTVQNIRVENRGVYLMAFFVTDGMFQTEPTRQTAPFGSETIGLAGTTFAAGKPLSIVLNPLLGLAVTAAEQVVLGFNGRTAVYTASGGPLNASIVLTKIEEPTTPLPTPPHWPAGIPVNNLPFANWDGTIAVAQIWTCAPRHAEDAAAACNWAAANGYTVRPRGIMHNWSPFTVPPGLPVDPKVLLIDTTKSLNALSLALDGELGPRVKVGTGATMGQLMQFLHTGGGQPAPAAGWSFPHIPAPNHLTVGGVLAINGHGTAVPNPLEGWPVGYGSMSNRILELTAIVTDPADAADSADAAYVVRTFRRGEADTKAFLTQLGRALIVDATLQVIPDYNLRCQSFMDIGWQTLFAAPDQSGRPPAKSLADFLEQTGRAEAIWFPFSENPWLKVWSHCPVQPAGSRLVTGPNNYPFSDNLPDWVTGLIRQITTDLPSLTPTFGKAMQEITRLGLSSAKANDLWGASKNTLFYVKDTTLRVTANGYAVRLKRSDVQQAVHLFAVQYQSMLAACDARRQWPVNSPLEIRITSLDTPQHVPAAGGADPGRPVISSLSADAVSEAHGWDTALWLDVLTLPGTPYANDFYAEMEEWLLATFRAPFAEVLPEWSKGWAYVRGDGAWKNSAVIDGFRQTLSRDRATDDTWEWARATLARYDAKNLFQSPLTETLFGR